MSVLKPYEAHQHYEAQIPEGCTPQDAKVLREANHALAAQGKHAEDVADAAKERIVVVQREADRLRSLIAEIAARGLQLR